MVWSCFFLIELLLKLISTYDCVFALLAKPKIKVKYQILNVSVHPCYFSGTRCALKIKKLLRFNYVIKKVPKLATSEIRNRASFITKRGSRYQRMKVIVKYAFSCSETIKIFIGNGRNSIQSRKPDTN